MAGVHHADAIKYFQCHLVELVDEYAVVTDPAPVLDQLLDLAYTLAQFGYLGFPCLNFTGIVLEMPADHHQRDYQ